MNVLDATQSYEKWLELQIHVVLDDLHCKHKLMEKDAFTFFRATYYRWLQQAINLVPELDGPVIACVGDLHMENFGTWRDGRGQQVWGINDFDESEELPYAFDLARLATSASLAIDEDKVAINHTDAHDAILTGYVKALTVGGSPFILGENHKKLSKLVATALSDPENWWRRLTESPTVGNVPRAAANALKEVLPEPDWHYQVRPRVAGVGSRGHLRFVATGNYHGTTEAREMKQMAPPAGRWLGHPPTQSALNVPIVRSPDPWQAKVESWQARRIAPNCIKLDLKDLKTVGNETRLFAWMGRETANIHLGDSDRIALVHADVAGRKEGWLSRAARILTEATRADWRRWKSRSG